MGVRGLGRCAYPRAWAYTLGLVLAFLLGVGVATLAVTMSAPPPCFYSSEVRPNEPRRDQTSPDKHVQAGDWFRLVYLHNAHRLDVGGPPSGEVDGDGGHALAQLRHRRPVFELPIFAFDAVPQRLA